MSEQPRMDPRPSPRAAMTDLLSMTQGKYKPSATLPAAAGLPGRHPADVPLVPIFVGIDRDGEVIREQFMWRLGEKGAEPAMAAQRLSRELRLPPLLEKTIEDSIVAGIKPFKNPVMALRQGSAEGKGAVKEHLIEIEIDVAVEGLSFKDRVLWDLLEPMNSPEGYALTVCRDLGLGPAMYEAIRRAVAERLERELAAVQEKRQKGEPLQGLEPPAKRIREGTAEELSRWAPAVRVVKAEEVKAEEAEAGAAVCEREGSPGSEFQGAAKDETDDDDRAVSEVKDEPEDEANGTPGQTSGVKGEEEEAKPKPTESGAEARGDDEDEEEEEGEDDDDDEDEGDEGGGDEEDDDVLGAELQLAMEAGGEEQSGAAGGEEEEDGEEEQEEENLDDGDGQEGEEEDEDEDEEGDEGEDDGMDLDGIDFSSFGDD